MQKYFYLLCMSVMLFACKERQEAAVENRNAPTLEAGDPYTEDLLVGTFSGSMPCADCPGVTMTLTLRPDNTYTMLEEYQRDQTDTLRSEGTWTLRDRGEKLQLLQQGATHSRDFDVEDENTIRLDIPINKREHDEEAYSLTRVTATAAQPTE